MLIGFDHQENPQNDSDQAQHHGNQRPEPESNKAADTHDDAETYPQDRQSAEYHDGLRGVKSHEGPFVDQYKYDSG
jgi:hypothetical protein